MTAAHRSDQQRITEILTQTIVSLCNSGLQFNAELTVEGLLGITLDKADVFLVNIKEVVSRFQLYEKADLSTFPSVSPPLYQSASQHGLKRKRSALTESPVHTPGPPQVDSSAGVYQAPEGCNQGLLSPGIHTTHDAARPVTASLQQSNVLDVKHEHSQSGRMGSRQNLVGQLGASGNIGHHIQAVMQQQQQQAVGSDKAPPFVSSSPDASHLAGQDSSMMDGLAIPKEEPEYSEGDYGTLPALDSTAGELQDLSSTGHDLFESSSTMPHLQSSDMSVANYDRTSQLSDQNSHEEAINANTSTSSGAISSYTQRHYNDNTMKCTLSNVRIVRRWLAEQKGELREVQDIPVPELNDYLKEMWMSIRKQNGAEYGGSTLKYLKIHLNLYLMAQTNGRVSLNTKDFAQSNLMWERKWKALTAAEALRKPAKPATPKEPHKKSRKLSKDKATVSSPNFRAVPKDGASLSLLPTQAGEVQTSAGSSGPMYQPHPFSSSVEHHTQAQQSPLPGVHEIAHGTLHGAETDSTVGVSSMQEQLQRIAGLLPPPHLSTGLPDLRSNNRSSLPPVLEVAHGQNESSSTGLTEHGSPQVLEGKTLPTPPAVIPQEEREAATGSLLPPVHELAQSPLAHSNNIEQHNHHRSMQVPVAQSSEHRSQLPSVQHLTQRYLSHSKGGEQHLVADGATSQLPPVSEIVTSGLTKVNTQNNTP